MWKETAVTLPSIRQNVGEFNPFVTNVTFLFPLKTSENLKVF